METRVSANCPIPNTSIEAYRRDAVPEPERRALRAHLAACPHCTEYLAQMRKTINLTGRLEPEDLTPQMREEFTDLYRRWRSEQQ